MTMDRRKATGNEGEFLVCKYLEERSHTILKKNYRSGHLEIDIISLDREGIHFVEVKTRRPPMQADPQDSVTPAKQRKIATAARRFLTASRQKELELLECHFDVAAVVINGNTASINYIKDAYIPIF